MPRATLKCGHDRYSPRMAVGFDFSTFEAWYDDHARRLLEPARLAARQALSEVLDERLPEPQRQRIRVTDGRVKSKQRTWQKLNAPKYEARPAAPTEIPAVLDDLVGLRIVCTNVSDALRVFDLVRSLDHWDPSSFPVLALEPGSERDYLSTAKESGYRALHANLVVSVSRGTSRATVRCELQIRTLLQDSWGELTHEDTYKPGSPVPQLVETLSRRMADLLSTLDDIAEDLRAELDRLSAVNLTEVDEVDGTPPGTEGSVAQLRLPVAQFLRARVDTLDSPVDLATLAWEVQREFGQDIISGWLGYGSFKQLLISSVANIRVSNVPPSFVIPAGYEFAPAASSLPAHRHDDQPRSIGVLRAIDRTFPLLETDGWLLLFKSLSEGLARVPIPADRIDMRWLNLVTRAARDTAQVDGAQISRSNVDYVAKALFFRRELVGGMTPGELAERFAEASIARLGEAISVTDADRSSVRDLLGLG